MYKRQVFGTKLRGEQLRILLAIMVLSVSFKIALDLLLQPSEPVSYTHLRAHETVLDLVCRLLLEKTKTTTASAVAFE